VRLKVAAVIIALQSVLEVFDAYKKSRFAVLALFKPLMVIFRFFDKLLFAH